MPELLQFEAFARKKKIDQWMEVMGGWWEKADQVAEEYRGLITTDPKLAIKQLPDFLDKARDINPERSFVEAVAGGPNPDWTAPLIDIIGAVYPSLDKQTRKEALSVSLNFLDVLNYFNSQQNVELINEPWLVSDIVINRPLYWCGFKKYCNLLEKNPTWESFYPHLKSVRSAFWLGMAVSRTKYASEPVQTNFYRMFPTLMDRTQDAIAAIIFVNAQNDYLEEDTPIIQSIESSLFKYDPRLYKGIVKKIEERKWVDLDQGVYVGDSKGKDRSDYIYRSDITPLS